MSIVIARNDCRDKTSPSPFIVMFGLQLNLQEENHARTLTFSHESLPL
ncbi:hypothetical protein HMPREF1869_00998 [Bacteroidales bacterium KA00251]|nr:hypothetical protein HMPREF1869_00998 [Bacteroidales bacterium KA00251]